MRASSSLILLAALLAGCADSSTAPRIAPGDPASFATTIVQKHFTDADNNGIPDAGVVVNGRYVSVYAYDYNGDWYWDLGDGRVQGSVSSVDALDSSTRTVCTYQVQYRGTFENTPFMDTGWILNAINCKGTDKGNYTYLFVHETDPRYTGNPDWSVWGNWEYHVLTESHSGNLVAHSAHPANAVGAQ